MLGSKAESMVSHRQIWCWKMSQEFYIWLTRQQEKRMSHQAWLELLKSQRASTSDTLASIHMYSNRATFPNILIRHPVQAYGVYFYPNHSNYSIIHIHIYTYTKCIYFFTYIFIHTHVHVYALILLVLLLQRTNINILSISKKINTNCTC